MAAQHPLTTYLLTSYPHSLEAATITPFLRAAGCGELPAPALSQWLSQDRLYAQSYIRFAGQLLSKIRLPSHNPNSAVPKAPTAEHRAIDVLVEALVNVRRELNFFEEVALEYGLDLTAMPSEGTEKKGECRCGGGNGSEGCECEEKWRECVKERGCTTFFGPNMVTKGYMDMFMSAGSSGVTLLEGMVVLWASEVCYLRAWKYAKSVSGDGIGAASGSGDFSNDADGGALRAKFIPNWTNAEFEEFVNRIGDVVNELAGRIKGAEEGEYVRGKCIEWWRQVLRLEQEFWPCVKAGEK